LASRIEVTFLHHPETPRLKLAVIGTGYVGIACAIGFAELGYTISGYDILEERIALLKRGHTPYHEAGLTESLATHIESGAISFTHDLSSAVRDAAYILVTVGTPSNSDGSADLSAVDTVVARLSELDLGNSVIVMRSTVPAGTCDEIADRLGPRTEVLFAPEFLREGSAVRDFLHPDRIVVGARTLVAGARFAELFETLGCQTMIVSLRDAELAKCMSNAFLAMKISFANQVANLCDEINGDALDVLRAIGADRRIGSQFLQPGIGFGGPCFEKDLKSLIHYSNRHGADCDLLRATLDVNERQPRRIVEILEAELGRPVGGLRIGVWGLTFKAGTDDLRDSLALRIVDDLVGRCAGVTAYDPAYKEGRHVVPCRMAATPLEAADCDALLVLTEWPQFRAIDANALVRKVRTGLVIDGRNVLDGDALAAVGLRYRGMGRRRLTEPVAEPVGLAATG
jgi:UDPglucose 6-dehydrogenase